MIKFASNLIIICSLLVLISCGKTVETEDEFEQVELPDGSIVSLNKNSKISYDGSFEPRIVKLEGEAFFSVNEGETPFIVETEDGEVEVVGTEFNVKSKGDKMEVEVEEGGVKMKLKSGGGPGHGLKKGQQGLFIKGGKNDIKIGRAQFKFKLWLGDLKIEFKNKGRNFKVSPKHLEKYNKEMQKDMKKYNKDLYKGGKKLNKDFDKKGKKGKK